MASEASIVNRICKELKTRGIWYEKRHGDIYARRGQPDLLVVIEGRAFFLEVKRPGQAPTPLQAHRLEQCRNAGAVAEVVRSLDDVCKILEL